MTLISGFPQDLYRHQIYPSLTASERNSLSQVSKAVRTIVQAMAEFPQEDINLAGEGDSIQLDGSIAAYLRQKRKMDILTDQPTLLVHLRRARATLICLAREHPEKAARCNPDDIVSISNNHGHEYHKPSEVVVSLSVLFDFHTKKFGALELEVAASTAIQMNNNQLVRAVLFCHPNSMTIPGGMNNPVMECSYLESAGGISQDGPAHGGGLGILLQQALNTVNKTDEEKLRLLKIISSHPNAGDIRVHDLQRILHYNTGILNSGPEIVKAIFSLPNAIDISAECLSTSLLHAVRHGNIEMVRVIFSHSNAMDIPANYFVGCSEDGYTLEDALNEAKERGNTEMIKLLLSQPNAAKTSNCTIL